VIPLTVCRIKILMCNPDTHVHRSKVKVLGRKMPYPVYLFVKKISCTSRNIAAHSVRYKQCSTAVTTIRVVQVTHKTKTTNKFYTTNRATTPDSYKLHFSDIFGEKFRRSLGLKLTAKEELIWG